MTIEEIIKNGTYTLVDVRESEELEIDGKIDFAVHIPLGEIPNHIDEISDLTKPIILFCRSGNRSGKAIDFLEKQAVEELYNGGGYNDLIQIIG
jgi:phage shock protein E